jgi:triosephosphate isomerase
MKRRYLVAGNWKMNGSLKANATLVSELLAMARQLDAIDIAVCPPSVYLESVAKQLAGSAIRLGAQNLSDQSQPGAFTGEVLSAMLVDVGCHDVLVGHSERRSLFGEDDATVARKFGVAKAAGLRPILCIGESLAERDSDQTHGVLERQLKAVIDSHGISAIEGTVIAYEPVWAIGTGRTASPEQAQDAHQFIRGVLKGLDANIAGSTPLLYGGSVKADNAASLFSCEDVDGGLIGGAALKAADFLAICAAARALA